MCACVREWVRVQKTLEREDATRRSFSTSWTDEFIFERASVRSTRPRIIQSLSLRSNCCIGECFVLGSENPVFCSFRRNRRKEAKIKLKPKLIRWHRRRRRRRHCRRRCCSWSSRIQPRRVCLKCCALRSNVVEKIRREISFREFFVLVRYLAGILVLVLVFAPDQNEEVVQTGQAAHREAVRRVQPNVPLVRRWRFESLSILLTPTRLEISPRSWFISCHSYDSKCQTFIKIFAPKS